MRIEGAHSERTSTTRCHSRCSRAHNSSSLISSATIELQSPCSIAARLVAITGRTNDSSFGEGVGVDFSKLARRISGERRCIQSCNNGKEAIEGSARWTTGREMLDSAFEGRAEGSDASSERIGEARASERPCTGARTRFTVSAKVIARR